MAGLLSKERTLAKPGYNRWLVPPAALAIHLCIGMAYGYSVFWLPLTRAVGVTEAMTCADDMGFLARMVATGCDWRITELGWVYTLFFIFLGSSAAIFGGWMEREGPRKAGVIAAFCWGGGLILSGVAVYVHQLWLLWLGSGVIGGIGLGLGYISPVSTLIKWFPDRRGMATGLAIMGFGGGAMIGAPLADRMINFFATETSVGVWETFVVLGLIYFIAMLAGAFGYRVAPDGWHPEGWTAPDHDDTMITKRHVHVNEAHKTPQFWLLWGVLCLNVSAGIGVIGMASPMLQEVFGGALLGVEGLLEELTETQQIAIASLAAGFTGLLSLFNIIGRISWASLSDYIGRKTTYHVFFGLGIVLYAAAPFMGNVGSVSLFVAIFCIIVSMYGGGFATIPAYLADLFGTRFVAAIHGRILTAWSTAGILGPVLVNYIREFQLDAGVPTTQVYNTTMYILAGLLLLGLLCNTLVKPVAEKHFMTEAELERERKLAHEERTETAVQQRLSWHPRLSSMPRVVISWILVGIPLLWGTWQTLETATRLFG